MIILSRGRAFYLFMCSFISLLILILLFPTTTLKAASIYPTPRVSILSPGWGATEGSNFINLSVQVNAADSASVIGHYIEFIPYICSSDSIFDTCELDYLSYQGYTFSSLNETNNLTFNIIYKSNNNNL